MISEDHHCVSVSHLFGLPQSWSILVYEWPHLSVTLTGAGGVWWQPCIEDRVGGKQWGGVACKGAGGVRCQQRKEGGSGGRVARNGAVAHDRVGGKQQGGMAHKGAGGKGVVRVVVVGSDGASDPSMWVRDMWVRGMWVRERVARCGQGMGCRWVVMVVGNGPRHL